MNSNIEKRTLITSKYIVENNCSIVQAATELKEYFENEKIPFSQSTIHSDIKTRLSLIDNDLYMKVLNVIERNTTTKNVVSEATIVFEHDVNNVSFSALAKIYGISKTTIYEKYNNYKKTELYKYTNVNDNFEYSDEGSKREKIENHLLSICNYALKNLSTLPELSDKFNISQNELKGALSELLPIIHYDMYFVLKDQLGLIEEANRFSKKR